MRTLILRILLPLTILVAAPILGWGGRAQAGYVEPVSLIAAPPADSFAPGASQSGLDEMGMVAESADATEPAGARCEEEKALLASRYGSLSGLLNSSVPSTGAGSSPAPDGPGAGGASQTPALASQPQTDAPVLAGVLFLRTALRWPPPFPSRLFRPPRLS